MKRVLCILLLLVLVLSGCTPAGTTTTKTTSSAPAQTSSTTKSTTVPELKGEVKFAYVGPVTGDAAQYGKMIYPGVELAVEKVNANGGINGKKMVIKIFDSKNDPKESVEIARLIGQDPTILATIGDFSSGSCMAAAPIYQEYGLSQVSPTAGNMAFPAINKYQFLAGTTNMAETYFIAHLALPKELKVSSVAVIYNNNDTGLAVFAAFKKECAAAGIKIVASEMTNPGETDFTAVLSKINQTKPESLLTFVNYTESANIIKQAKSMDMRVKYYVNAASRSDRLIELLGKDAEGVYSDEAFGKTDTTKDSPYAKLAKEYEKRAGLAFSMFGIYGYDTAGMVAAAATACGDKLTRDTFRDSLANLKGFVGLSGPLTFAADRIMERPVNVLVLLQVKAGIWTQLTDFTFYDK